MFTRGLNGPTEAMKVAGNLEAAGIDHIFMSEAGNDAMTTLAAMALATETAVLGSGIANIFIRHPYELAMAAAAVDDLSAGRFTLGIGTAHQITNENGLHLDMDKAFSRLRDYLTTVRGVLDAGREQPQVQTDRYQVTGPRIAWNTERRIPILLGALGDRMVRLAGETADGVILSLATLSQVERIRGLLDESATAAGRSPSDVKIFAVVNTCLRPTREEARAFLRKNLAGYFMMPFYEQSLRRGGIEVVDGEVPDDAVDSIAIAGPPEWAHEQIASFRTAGVDIPLLAPAWCNSQDATAYQALAALVP